MAAKSSAARVARVALIAVLVLIAAVVAAAALWGARGRAIRAEVLGGAPASVDWPRQGAECLSEAAVAACLAAVRSVPGFGPVSPAERAKLAEAAARISREHGCEVRAEQLETARTMEAALVARTSGVRAQRFGDQIAAASARGDSVLAIAARHRLPPVAVLRQILVEAGHSAIAVRALLADPAQLPPKLRDEAPAVFAADLGARGNAEAVQRRAQAYEDALVAHLRAPPPRGLGLRLKTEAELRAAGAQLTPDALLDAPATIGGHQVRWLDAKNYPMWGSRLVAGGLARQAEKYTRAFGPGAMVFSGGVACGASVRPARGAPPLLLDGSHIAAAS